MTHEEKVARWIGTGKIGVEIGAFKTPIPGIKPFYVDRFAEFAGERCLADFLGDATALPFHDDSLDYVVSSHVLEHVANPIAALAEWYRVLRPGGIIYMVVPDRRYTWDHARALTTVDHLLEDFDRGTTPVDATHIDEFVTGVDWSTYSPATPPADVPGKQAELMAIYHAAVSAGREINIHFHVFEPANLDGLITRLSEWPRTRFQWRVVDRAERFPTGNPNGCLIVIHVDKSPDRRASRDAEDPGHPRDAASLILPGATPLPGSRLRPLHLHAQS